MPRAAWSALMTSAPALSTFDFTGASPFSSLSGGGSNKGRRCARTPFMASQAEQSTGSRQQGKEWTAEAASAGDHQVEGPVTDARVESNAVTKMALLVPASPVTETSPSIATPPKVPGPSLASQAQAPICPLKKTS